MGHNVGPCEPPSVPCREKLAFNKPGIGPHHTVNCPLFGLNGWRLVRAVVNPVHRLDFRREMYELGLCPLLHPEQQTERKGPFPRLIQGSNQSKAFPRGHDMNIAQLWT